MITPTTDRLRNFSTSSLFLLSVCMASIVICLGAISPMFAQNDGGFEVARVKYRGGGDWYNDPSSLANLIEFTRREAGLAVSTSYKDVSLGSVELFSYPFLFLTGHGNITANRTETENLRAYLDNGGFLYIDDDYGLDTHARSLMKQVFPDEEFIEIPFEHPIYDQAFPFSSGLPKIHEHDNQSPQGFGIFRNGKLVVFYTFESNLSDGWADAEVHGNPPQLRLQALQMGANILIYALTQS
ncbi:MAG: DUF4159 domain-containing protein [Bacteroidota bacterium]